MGLSNLYEWTLLASDARFEEGSLAGKRLATSDGQERQTDQGRGDWCRWRPCFIAETQ